MSVLPSPSKSTVVSFLLNLTTVKSRLVEPAATTLPLASSATAVAPAAKKGDVVEPLMTWRQALPGRSVKHDHREGSGKHDSSGSATRYFGVHDKARGHDIAFTVHRDRFSASRH